MELEKIQKEIHEIAVNHGWWDADKPRTFLDLIMLVVCECSEAVEEYRKTGTVEGNDHIAEELADVLIRVLDLAEHYNINMSEAIAKKVEFNKSRPYRHRNKKA